MFIIDGIYKLLETVYEYAEKELYDEDTLKKKLMELHVLFELGDVDETEYDELEEKLLEQLRIAREYNAEKKREMEDDDDDEF